MLKPLPTQVNENRGPAKKRGSERKQPTGVPSATERLATTPMLAINAPCLRSQLLIEKVALVR
eukprot:3050163-Pyramimonas_sp.AAC.2